MEKLSLSSKYSTTRNLFLTDPQNKNKNKSSIEKKDAREGGLRSKGYTKKIISQNQPLISIVTVVFNMQEFLKEAIESVINQDYENIEFIIIDGGSTDKTVEIIKEYEGQIDYWISEKDEGQSDAFIKAFKICNGDWLTWLNSDDLLLPGAISNLVNEIVRYPKIECFTGNVIWTTASNEIIKCRKGELWNNILPEFGILNVYGPTTFFKKTLYLRVNGINKNLNYKMDTDLWWQFYKSGAKFKRLKIYTWTLRFHENAKTSGHLFKNSKYYDKNHSYWKKTKEEKKYLEETYRLSGNFLQKIIGFFLLNTFRLFSYQYLFSFYTSNKFAGKKIKNSKFK